MPTVMKEDTVPTNIGLQTALDTRRKLTTAQVLTKFGYSVTGKVETRDRTGYTVTIRTWRKDAANV